LIAIFVYDRNFTISCDDLMIMLWFFENRVPGACTALAPPLLSQYTVHFLAVESFVFVTARKLT